MALFKRNSAQSSLEYLMTYGWALVLIVSVVSILVFIVSSPASDVTFSSSDPAKILLKAGAVQDSEVVVKVQNITGGDLGITGISETGYSDCTANGSGAPLSVSAGAEIVLECVSSSDGGGTITLDYTDFAGLQRVVVINGSGSVSSAPEGSVPEMFESNNPGVGGGAQTFGGINWTAQTFTPATAHTVTSVKLLLYRSNFPGTITVGIRATNEDSHPTGADLCYGTTDGDTLPSSGNNEWREISLGGGCDLEASAKYAIVTRAASAVSPPNYALWFFTTNNYAGGAQEFSWNSGSSWSTIATQDFQFEEWGTAS